ncbi:MAG: platelet-binding glycoprotein [Armatimonadetes bacterium CSP1-3]|nr:MAG: platelet-binding glycoprotein [Armatimonadetes bacterium CSP1-3]
MARLAYLGAELNDPGPGVEWTARSTTWPTISSSIKRSGGYSVQVTSLVSATPKWLAYQYVAGGGTGPFYYRVYLRPETLPSAENTIIVLNDAPSVATPAIWVTLDNTGVLRLYDEDGAIGSASPALTLQSFAHRIELEMSTVGGAGACIVRARLEGTEFAGSSTRSLSTGANSIIVGGNLRSEAQTQGEWYFDDIAINSSTGSFQNSYPGAGSIVALRPNAAGDSADFARGGTDSGANWSQTDEVTPNDVTDYVSSGTLDADDYYNVEAPPGDVDTVNMVGVFVRHSLSSSVGADPRFVTGIKASSGGTIEESASHILNSTAWFSNADGTLPSNIKLITYDLPGASTTPWTAADLATMQIGLRINVDDSDQCWISTLLALVEYVPTAGPVEESISLARSAAVAGSSQAELGNALSLGRSAAVIDSGQIEADISLSLARSAAITVAGEKVVEESISLGKSASVVIAEQLEVETAISQARNAAITNVEQVEAEAALSLGRSSAVSISEEIQGGAVEESITLSRSAAAVASAQIEVSAAVSLARTQAQTQIEDLVAEGVLSLGRSAAVAEADQVEAESPVALARSAAITAEGEIAGAPIEESITLGRIMRCAIPLSVPVEESISLARSSAIAESAQVDLFMDLILARAGAIAESDQVEAVGDLSLARTMAESLEEMLEAEVTTVLARLMGSELATQAEVGNSLALARSLGISTLGNINIGAALALDRVLAILAAGEVPPAVTLFVALTLLSRSTAWTIPGRSRDWSLASRELNWTVLEKS